MAKTTKADTEVINLEEAKKPVTSIIDLLLSDSNTLDLPTKDVEVKRLSKKYGVPFIVTCRALDSNTYQSIQNTSFKINGKDVDLDTDYLQVFTLIEGVYYEGKPLFKRKDLIESKKAYTPKELTTKLFLPGELSSMYNTIMELSGFDNDAVAEVKNLSTPTA